MSAKKVEVSSPKIGIEPPGLELDLGYSILDARPSIKVKLSLGAISRKKESDRFTIPIRKWWVRYRGARHGKQGLVSENSMVRTSFEDEILRERHLKISDLTSASETELGEARKAVEDLTPVEFVASSVVERLRNQSSAWLKLFKEALIQAKQNFDRASAEQQRTENDLDNFIKRNSIVAKRPPARMSTWDRVASLAALVLIEGLISLPPIAEKQGGQLILSFLYPVTVSIANAIIGVLVGLLGVYEMKHAKNNIIKIISGFGIAFSFIIIAWMNIKVARWREGNDLPISINSILPETALSVVLLVIGFGVFSFAVYKGVRDFSRGFPGHEEKWDEYINAYADFHAWKDRYLLLVHEMRRTSSEKLDQIRQQLNEVRQEHEARKVIASQMIIDLQTIDKILPSLHERINSSARVLIKAYRESAYMSKKNKSSSNGNFSHQDPSWMVNLPDIQSVKTSAENLTKIIDNNLSELSKFENLFEKEIAANVNKEIESVAEEAKCIASESKK